MYVYNVCIYIYKYTHVFIFIRFPTNLGIWHMFEAKPSAIQILSDPLVLGPPPLRLSQAGDKLS